MESFASIFTFLLAKKPVPDPCPLSQSLKFNLFTLGKIC